MLWYFDFGRFWNGDGSVKSFGNGIKRKIDICGDDIDEDNMGEYT